MSLKKKASFSSDRNHIRFFVFLIGFFLVISPVLAEEEATTTPYHVGNRKGKWTFQWGYNRSGYTQSDINFRGPGYHYTYKSVDAKDKPERLSAVYIDPTKFEIPQYNLKASYFFSDHFFLAFGQDHMKYVVTQGQPVAYSGYVDPLAIQKNNLHPAIESIAFQYLFPGHIAQMAGYHGGEEVITLTPDILKFEHTDGLNFLFLDAGYLIPMWTAANGESALSWVTSAGGGMVVCRTDARVMGKGQNNNFHISGYGVSGYTAGRYEFMKTYFLELGGKAGYIDLTDILTSGGSNRASQNFGFVELVFSGGIAI
ncbi:hypothetical protein [Leptospira ilyithenensis]|uniref:hypothetical protein n=1 Tax=Leptospira ilyithenensis TaxID=2484901 RepID=UPI001FEB8FAC|nr:hypothetical protein [Leptospira ilyithenensis]